MAPFSDGGARPTEDRRGGVGRGWMRGSEGGSTGRKSGDSARSFGEADGVENADKLSLGREEEAEEERIGFKAKAGIEGKSFWAFCHPPWPAESKMVPARER
jgi:hypothetical protein